MIKLLSILFFGLVCESIGAVLLKKGIDSVSGGPSGTLPELAALLKAGATHPQILWGVFFEAIFFGCLLALMARSDLSFLWPLTGLSFVFATFAAMWFLQEHVSGLRWLGVALIMAGAAIISYSEHTKSPREVSAPAVAQQPMARK